MEEREKDLTDKSKALRRCLKDQVAHPYITSQGLSASEKTDKEADVPLAPMPEGGED